MTNLAQWVMWVGVALGVQAPPDDFARRIDDLASRDRKVQEAAIEGLGTLGDSRALPALTALRQGSLYLWTPAGGSPRLVIVAEKFSQKDGTELARLLDAANAAPVLSPPQVPLDDLKRVVATNALKMKIAPVISRLSLASPDPRARSSAATRMGDDRDAAAVPLLEDAFRREKDAWTRHAMESALESLRLEHADPLVRLAAANRLREIAAVNAVPALKARLAAKSASGEPAEKETAVRSALESAVRSIESHQDLTQAVGTSFHVLSLSSILMVTALGLAITFGLMGVINMAHGEMLMIGAYAAYAVQSLFRSSFPGAFGWYFVAALPVSFLAAAGLGLLIERALLRHLYRRPLESLLATWGVSLILQQAVRQTFGAANVDIQSPDWMQGGLQVMAGLVLPYNRLFILLFSGLVLLAVYLILWRSPAGLRIRAVMQNRSMAACLGVATSRVDSLTFAMGAGVAGLAGCALSQLGTVGPGLGQTYIVDTFMVVVLGGVGKLLGTVVAAFGIGGLSKILESLIGAELPKWGPILSKVSVLALLVLFLQKRPSGLFAPKGRHADA